MKTINPGEYSQRISFYQPIKGKTENGFLKETDMICILKTYAKVKTTRGMVLIANNSDFEKAYTNFTIRYPKVKITRDMYIEYENKTYTIEYLNNIDEKNIELEIQAKEVTKQYGENDRKISR